jgi:nitric oxide reductase NorD protein
MDTQALKERFYELIAPDIPNDWEVEEAVEPLADDPQLDAILAQIPVIWPISNSLCYNYLGQVRKALACIRPSELPAWVNETLDHYEAGGLGAAQQFMVDIDLNFACRLQGQGGVRLTEVEGWLLPYAQGLAGGGLRISPAAIASTDTETLYLPWELNFLSRDKENILLYKLLASYQWAFIHLGTFFPDIPPNYKAGERMEVLQIFLHLFSEPHLACRLYHTLETLRAGFFLQRELPGLMRETRELRRSLIPVQSFPGKNIIFFTLDTGCCLLEEQVTSAMPHWYGDVLLKLTAENASAETSVGLCQTLYERVVYAEKQGDNVGAAKSLVFQGELRLQEVYAVRKQQKKVMAEAFVETLSTYLLQLPQAREVIAQQTKESSGSGENYGDQAIVIEHGQGKNKGTEESIYLTIDNKSVELPPELQQMVRQMETDFNRLPAQYIASAVGLAGQSMAEGEFVSEMEDTLVMPAPVTYDEWDYRRKGFRKNWCVVNELEMKQARSNFVPATLAQYHGQIIRLRHQFEMMRNQERFLRRQRDGDDIDFDALVESITDTRAGLAPSDRLFIRLKRDERDIAAFFLVDMSNSTEGWVGMAIKESLVLICEAMESLGDRYGIYGFSGMQRLRCEMFHIKHLGEPYNEEVKQRIGAIAPREYTRMAPAIRHLTALFKNVDAKVRLLITISDGKPEDYDNYKGDYAIEDTRHALLESKSAGIHPFCITIDQHAHDYMAHMYGEVNYIFINNVAKLPARMPEIYRLLTS